MRRITILLGIFVLFVAFFMFSNFVFAVPENPMFDAKPDFADTVRVEEMIPFSLKMSNLEYYRISDIEPIITIMPKSASKFVHVEINPQISTLWDGFYQNTNGTIYVDKGISVDRIFVSVSFMGKNPDGEQVSLTPDSTFNASIKIEKPKNKEVPSDFVSDQKNNEKPSCTNQNVPLYGCSDVVTVKIDSPLKQFKSGVPIDQIQCKEGLMLVKKHDNRPACIKASSLSELNFRRVVDCVWNCTIPIPENHIDKDKTTDTDMVIDGKSFYYYAINETLNSAQGEGKKISFHDVTFTLFPRPKIMNLGGFCGSGSFGTSILFSDGIHESLWINIPETECMDKFTKADLTKLTNHTDSQAGLAFFDDGVRLLVNSDAINADTNTTQEVPTYEIIRGNDTFFVGEQITFQVKAREIQDRCSSPEYRIVNKHTGKTVWEVLSEVYPCPPPREPQKIVEYVMPLPNENVKTPIINETGDYVLSLTYGTKSTSLEFSVVKKSNARNANEPYTTIEISFGNLTKSNLLPVVFSEITHNAEYMNEILVWNFELIGHNADDRRKTWDTIPDDQRIFYKITDEYGKNVIDSTHMPDNYGIPDDLHLYSMDCGLFQTVDGESAHPTVFAVKKGTSTLIAKNSNKGILPISDGTYSFEFASMFETEVKLPKNAEIITQESKQCKLVQGVEGDPDRTYTDGYYTKMVFKLN